MSASRLGRCGARRPDTQQGRRRRTSRLQGTRDFERQQGPHAVTEQDVWPVELGQHRRCHGVDNRAHRGDRALAMATVTTRQLDGPDVDIRRQRIGPRTEQRRTAARVREADQTRRGGRARREPAQPCARHWAFITKRTRITWQTRRPSSSAPHEQARDWQPRRLGLLSSAGPARVRHCSVSTSIGPRRWTRKHWHRSRHYRREGSRGCAKMVV